MNKDREFYNHYYQKLSELKQLIIDYGVEHRVVASSGIAMFNEDGTPFMENDFGDNSFHFYVAGGVDEVITLHESIEESFALRMKEREENDDSGKFDNFGFSLN